MNFDSRKGQRRGNFKLRNLRIKVTQIKHNYRSTKTKPIKASQEYKYGLKVSGFKTSKVKTCLSYSLQVL